MYTVASSYVGTFAIEAAWVNRGKRIVEKVGIAVEALRVGGIIAATVWIGPHPTALGAVVLAELGVAGGGFGIVVQLGVVVLVQVGARSNRLGIAEGQGCVRAFHGSIVRGAQPLRAQPILVLEVRRAALVKGHGLPSPVILPLNLGSSGSIPRRDALACCVERKIRDNAACRRAHSLVQRAVEVGRCRTAIHREDVAIGVVGVAVETVVGHVAGYAIPPFAKDAKDGAPRFAVSLEKTKGGPPANRRVSAEQPPEAGFFP